MGMAKYCGFFARSPPRVSLCSSQAVAVRQGATPSGEAGSSGFLRRFAAVSERRHQPRRCILRDGDGVEC